jgi:hypothetical protein
MNNNKYYNNNYLLLLHLFLLLVEFMFHAGLVNGGTTRNIGQAYLITTRIVSITTS